MPKPIRILHVLGGTGAGGAESRIMDLYRQMDKTEIQFDFLVHSSAVKRAGDDVSKRTPQFFDEEIKSMGGHIYVLPKFRVYNYFTYRKAIRAFFAAHHEFKAVQGHMTSTASIYLPLAKKAGIPMTVAHSRNAGVEKGLKGMATKILRRNLYRIADKCFACSELAGIDVFGKKWVEAGNVKIIHNAIDAGKFIYQPEKRAAMRKKLGIEDKFVLGHVGRFDTQKNHPYLIDIFAETARMREDAVLVLLGDGPDKEKMQEKCSTLGIRDKVFFEGVQRNPQDYYQAFDIFLLPSFHEGLPGVLVEAQAAGLPCLVSDTVTKEAQATELVTYLSIDLPPEVWAQEIAARMTYERRDTYRELTESGFDVKKQVDAYRKFYLYGDDSEL
ncbi:MAG: glycosyltransferase family 1 protein [Roseburia sp.]|nr:glycosyltransferase family 1 protein [Roseburia sp.]MCM1242276.1 glycosyltransferase family 1 protein [Roseburia sp.]